MSREDKINAESLRELLSYHADTGKFFWRRKVSFAKKAGDEAGHANRDGYKCITIKGIEFLAHRLAWLHVNGEWPVGKITFKNNDRYDCRFENLEQLRYLEEVFDHKTREGRNAYLKAHREAHPVHYRDKTLRRDFGIGLREYEAKFLEQNGCCEICKNPETATRKGRPIALAVDHNHDTGKIRGLLCASCNKMIGLALEKPETLRNAISYLRKYSGEEVVVPLRITS